MIKVSEFSSLEFRRDWKLGFQQQVDYAQEFLYTDTIQIQYITDLSVLPILSNNTTGVSEALTPTILQEGDVSCYQLTINHSITEDTCFTLSFVSDDVVVLSSEYIVRMELPGTILLEYTNRRNALDTIFGTDRFSFRVEGSFLPQEVQFSNDTEDFRDQRFVSKVLSANAYEQKKLTLGGGFGVPNWVARKINLIFSLSSVHVDGVPMVRSEGSAIEITVLGNYYPLYIYKLLLEESEDAGEDTLSAYLRSVDEKKKLVRSISEDEVRTYIDDLGLDMAKMIRELDLITALSENYVIEIDDTTSSSTKRTSLSSLANFLKAFLVSLEKWNLYIDQPLKSTDTPTFAGIFTDEITSTNYTPGLLGSGHQLKDGKLEIDELVVRKSATFIEAIVQKMRYMGGVYVLSPATGFEISEVEIEEEYYRCFFSGGDNEFVVGDQARIQDFTTGKNLWSLVINVGSNYIDISRTDCVGAGIPQVGDDIVQLGNRDNVDRQDAVLLTAVNGEVGIITYYGINDFTLEGKEGSWLGKHGGRRGAVIKGEFYFNSGQSVEDAINTMSGASSFKEVVLDLTGLNVNTYYPLVFPANTEPQVSYRVYRGPGDGAVSWSTHWFQWIVLDCQWDDIGGGASDYFSNIVVNTYESEFSVADVSPIGKLGKLGKAMTSGQSQEYCYLRGGSIYRCRIPSVIEGNPEIYPEGFTYDDTTLPIHDLTELLTADTIDIEAVEAIIPRPVVQLREVATEVQFTKDRLSLIATETMYSGATSDNPIAAQLSSRIDVNANGISLLNQSYTNLNNNVTQTQNQVTVNKNGISALNTSVSGINTSISNINKTLNTATGDIDAITQGFEELSEDFNTLNGEYQEVKAAGIVTSEDFVTIFAGKANSLGESIVAGINVVPEGVTIQGSKISLNGAVAVNSSDGETTVSINNDTGVLTARGADISGKLTSGEGEIGGFTINENSIVNGGLSLTTDVLSYTGTNEEIHLGSEYYSGGGTSAYSLFIRNSKPSTTNTIQYCARFTDGTNAVSVGSLLRGFSLQVDATTYLNGALYGRLIHKTTEINRDDTIILVNSSSAVTLALPTEDKEGRILMIRKIGAGNVTITGSIRNGWNSQVSSVIIDNGDMGIFIYSGSYWTSNCIQSF